MASTKTKKKEEVQEEVEVKDFGLTLDLTKLNYGDLKTLASYDGKQKTDNESLYPLLDLMDRVTVEDISKFPLTDFKDLMIYVIQELSKGLTEGNLLQG